MFVLSEFKYGDGPSHCPRSTKTFIILLTAHIGTVRDKNQLDALFSVFISLLYMFRATQCSSSGESIVSIHHVVGGRLVCRSETCIPAYLHTYRMMY